MLKKSSRNILVLCIFLLVTTIFFVGVKLEDQTLMGGGLLGLFGYLMYYCLKEINAHITLFVFFVSFFTFLMGRMIIPLFYDTSDLLFDIGGADFSIRTLTHMYLCLFLSLLLTFVGYLFFFSKKELNVVKICDSKVLRRVRVYSKFILYFSYPFALIQILEKVYLVLTNGYVALYIDFESHLPYFFALIAGWFFNTIYIFLATLPSKSDAKIPIVLYLSIATISIGTGQRGSFVLGYLFIIMYLFIRNTLQPGNSPWIGRKGIIRLLVAAPFLMVFLFLMLYIRTDRDSSFSSNLLMSFFYQQGVSAEVIGYGLDYEKNFPKGKVYLIGDFTDYFRHNIFSRLFFGAKAVEPQTAEHALEDNNFDSALTYFVKPNLYLEGGGLGGCYIAEGYKDLGYFGVCLTSLIYGILLAKIPLWCRKNVWISSVGLAMFSQIIFAPRAHFIKPFYIFISINVMIVYLFLYLVSKKQTESYNSK